MKFLCVACDEPMRLDTTEGPEEGSLAVVFACPRCPNKVAMLTNPWETQLVRALDVHLGPPGASPSPMQFVRRTLARKREGLEEADAAAKTAPLIWDPAAEKRLNRAPEFIRPMARQSIERFAAERGYSRITERVMDEARSASLPPQLDSPEQQPGANASQIQETTDCEFRRSLFMAEEEEKCA